MQFQHGTFTKEANGSLILTPFAVDGRQLLSDPCKYKNSVYTRYNQPEVFKVRTILDAWPNLVARNRKLTNPRLPAALRGPPFRPLPRHPAPQPLQEGRLAHEPHVPRLQATADAADADDEPDRVCHGGGAKRRSRGNGDGVGQGEARAGRHGCAAEQARAPEEEGACGRG